MQWLGRMLANRENRMYQRLESVQGIARGFDRIHSGGVRLRHASAHEYIDGHPLRWHDKVHDQFFQQLEEILDQIHQRKIAYVDLNKAENIIVDCNGNPCLIDFQISLKPVGIWPGGWLLKILQASDRYHLQKHARRSRPDQYAQTAAEIAKQRPWWIRWHRQVAGPFRKLRRAVLVKLGVRSGPGKAHTERFIEEGLRAADQQVTLPTGHQAAPQRSAIADLSAKPGTVNSSGNDSGADKASKPILRLYSLLLSPGYAQSGAGQRAGSIASRMFADLCDRAPEHPEEIELVSQLDRATPHCRVVALLRNRAFFIHTAN